MEKQKYQIKYVGLCQFLKTYREKLLLNGKPTSHIDLETISFDHLKKVKQGYQDQFNLDFNELIKIMETNDKEQIDDVFDIKLEKKERKMVPCLQVVAIKE